MFQSKVLKPDSDALVEVAPDRKALIGIREILDKPLYVLMAAVGLVLLIACTNVAGLLTARTASRQRELAIRLAVGAGRGRIVRQLLTESIVIASLGGFAGLVIALWGTRLLTNFLQFHLDVKPDLRILLFASAISLASGILFGIIPALHSTRVPKSSTASEASGLQQLMSPVAQRHWFRNSLVVAQVALALVMLVGAGLFVRTLLNLKSINPGFDSRNVLLFGLDPVSLHYNDQQIQSLYRTLRNSIVSLPGITGVTYSQGALLSKASYSTRFRIEGRSDCKTQTLEVGPDFFRIMDIPLLTGRTFTAEELANARPVAMVNKTFVKQCTAERSPLGLHLGGENEIIGVVGDIKHINLRDEINPIAYLPLKAKSAHFEVRVAGNPSALIPTITKVVKKADPDLPIFDVKTQTKQIDELLVIERLVARLAAGFGLLALTLACVGLYGLLSYEVTRRTREIGIRLAVGAQPAMIQQTVLRETLVIVIIGVALGLPAALVSSKAISTMLYGVQANDPSTLLSIVAILVVVAGIAGYIPARRASLVDPTVALRAE